MTRFFSDANTANEMLCLVWYIDLNDNRYTLW